MRWNRTARRSALAALALNLLPALSAGGTAHAAGGPCPGTYTTIVSCEVTYVPYTGAAQTWTVPSGVSSVTFDVFGSQGGGGGGLGGEATATVAVTPGQTFQINVGGQGGFNGGGSGGNKGGGATDVRSGGYTLGERLIVAGGGGGQGGSGGAGGVGGGASGGNGNDPDSVKLAPLAGHSYGGSQTAGGNGGFGDDDGGNGALGVGGNGGTQYGVSGGGGGGGYYGGGGGSAAQINSTNIGGGGAGGSGFGPTGVALKSGVRGGNGQVVISYWPPTSSAAAASTPTQTPASPTPTPTSSTPPAPTPTPPATSSTAPRPDLAGARVQQPGAAAIYLVDGDGTLRHIPDPTTYNNLFRDSSGIRSMDVSTIASGPDLTSGAYLATPAAGGAIYLVSNGQKRHVSSPATMDKFWFNWGTVQTVSQASLDALPNGPDIS